MFTLTLTASVLIALILWFQIFPMVGKIFAVACPQKSTTQMAGEWHNERFKLDPEYFRKLEAEAKQLGYHKASDYSYYYMGLYTESLMPTGAHQWLTPAELAEFRKLGIYER